LDWLCTNTRGCRGIQQFFERAFFSVHANLLDARRLRVSNAVETNEWLQGVEFKFLCDVCSLAYRKKVILGGLKVDLGESAVPLTELKGNFTNVLVCF
jgi:hypothetical protein